MHHEACWNFGSIQPRPTTKKLLLLASVLFFIAKVVGVQPLLPKQCKIWGYNVYATLAMVTEVGKTAARQLKM